jgi:hypothetical protein
MKDNRSSEDELKNCFVIMITGLWYVTPCSMVEMYKNISEGSTVSIFTVQEQANELAWNKQLKACLA